jgi:hypothetical protein
MAISDYFELKFAPLALIPPILVAAHRWWRNRWGAFTVRVSDQSIAKKQTKVHYTVRARIPVTIKRLNVRFVERNWLSWWRFKDAPTNEIEVLEIGYPDFRIPYNKLWFLRDPDNVGGRDGIFRQPREWAAGEVLDIDVEVIPHKIWRGYLSLELVTKERRHFYRRRFAVLDEAKA